MHGEGPLVTPFAKSVLKHFGIGIGIGVVCCIPWYRYHSNWRKETFERLSQPNPWDRQPNHGRIANKTKGWE